MSFAYILVIVLLSISSFISLIILLKGKNTFRKIRNLGVVLLFYYLFFFGFTLWFDFGLLQKYPHLLRAFGPIIFLLFPVFYLSLRSVVTGNQYFKKTDFIHFLPAVFHFLELMPLYLLSSDEKLKIINQFFPDRQALSLFAHGLIPGFWVDLVRLCLMILYFTFSLVLVFKLQPELFNKLKREKFNNLLFTTLVFLFTTNLILILSFIKYFLFYFEYFSNNNSIKVGYVFLVFITFAYNCYLFFKIRLNLEENATEKSGIHEIEAKSNYVTDSSNSLLDWTSLGLNKDEVEARLNQLLIKEKIFLRLGLRVNEFALEANIPVRLLPPILELTFQKSFKALINERRIIYAKEKIDEGYLRQLTLESLRSDCGFSSRTTFFYAFKKEFSLSPSEYWDKSRENFS